MTLLAASGFIAIVITWILIIIPSLYTGVDLRQQTITEILPTNRWLHRSVTIGLHIGSIFQLLFYLHIVYVFELGIFTFSSFCYITASLAAFLITFFPESKHRAIHNLFGRYYFVVMPVAMIAISRQIQPTYTGILVLTTTLIIILITITGYLLYRFRRESAAIEIVIFSVLSIWTAAISMLSIHAR